MKRLRYSVAALIIFLAVLFNLERLDFGSENLLDIQTFVYVLAAVAAVAVVTSSGLQRRSAPAVIALWLVVYLALKIGVFNDRPFLGGLYTYVTITEIALLGTTVRLAHFLARQVLDFEQAIEHITLADTDGVIHTLETARAEINNEMLRSRRYNRPLSVTVVEPEPDSIRAAVHRTVEDVQRAMMARYIFTGLARRIRREMRRIDLVLEEGDRGRILIVSPETSDVYAARVVERIKAATAAELGVRVMSGTASFPDEALTFEELIERAEERMGKPETTSVWERETPLPTRVFDQSEKAGA